jgi:GGDEF domain-containing protein
VLSHSRGPGIHLLISLGAAGMVAVIGYIDHLTGVEISFSIFYLLPVAFAFWQGGLWPGAATAAAGAAAWLIADLSAGHQYTHALIPYWNALMRGLIFFTVGMLLVRLKRALERETHLATRDALTGIGNWRHFEAVAVRELGRAKRGGKPLSVASTLQDSVRTFDCVARLGGDEFIVLMPETDQEGARVVVARIRKMLEETLKESHWPSTLSVGLVTFAGMPETIDELIRTADDLMYRAKKSGKDSVAEQIVQRK